MDNNTHTIYFFDEFRLDQKVGCFLRGQEEVKLRKKTYQVLKYLVEREGGLVEREELIKAFWPESSANEHANSRDYREPDYRDYLEQCLKEIWRDLPDADHRIVKTIPKRGCRIGVPVTKKTYTDSAGVSYQETPAVGVITIAGATEESIRESQREPDLAQMTEPQVREPAPAPAF